MVFSSSLVLLAYEHGFGGQIHHRLAVGGLGDGAADVSGVGVSPWLLSEDIADCDATEGDPVVWSSSNSTLPGLRGKLRGSLLLQEYRL